MIRPLLSLGKQKRKTPHGYRTLEYKKRSGEQETTKYSSSSWEKAVQEGYIAGAKEQRQIDIEKTCEWLDNYLMEIGYPDDWLRDSPNIESGKERFKKAMGI